MKCYIVSIAKNGINRIQGIYFNLDNAMVCVKECTRDGFSVSIQESATADMITEDKPVIKWRDLSPAKVW